MRQYLLGCLFAMFAAGVFAEAGVTDRTIVIGQNISLDQGKNAYGVAALQGIKLYFDKANAEGGINGRKLVLQTLDDENKAANAAANARKLIADGAFILFGSIEGGPSTAVAEVANEAKVPFFGPMAGSPNLRRPYQPYVFPVRAEHRDEFRALMNWGKTTGMKTVGFVRADSPVGATHLENVRLVASELGMKVVLDLPFKGDVSDAQIAAWAKSIGDSRPDMVLNHGSGAVYQRLVGQARSDNVMTTFMGVNSGSTQIAAKLGPLAHGMVFAQVVPNPRDQRQPIVREFLDSARKARSSGDFSYGELEGYLTAKALVLALRASGKALTREGFVRTLETSRFDLGGYPVRWKSGDHEGSRFVDLSIVGKSGRFID
ncbi:MAG: ABC transporter substrate-binding protein [Dechloromonas sp.]|nr:ABC transporter substrate-binding protein [Dechloromonas sp.]